MGMGMDICIVLCMIGAREPALELGLISMFYGSEGRLFMAGCKMNGFLSWDYSACGRDLLSGCLCVYR